MTVKEFAEALLKLPDKDLNRILVKEDTDTELLYEIEFDNKYFVPKTEIIGLNGAGLDKRDNVKCFKCCSNDDGTRELNLDGEKKDVAILWV